MSADAFIQIRVTPEVKARLRTLAEREHITESALVRQLLLTLLWVQEPVVKSKSAETDPILRDSRLYLRLRLADRKLLNARALARGMPSATYVALLVRSHLHGVAPLPEAELLAVKQSVAELRSIGRDLKSMVRAVSRDWDDPEPGQRDVLRMMKVGEVLLDRIKGLCVTNIKAWRPAMPKRLVQLEGNPLFDLASYARRGSSRRDHLSPQETEQISLTVRRAPEVMVKVLNRGGQDLKSVGRHLSYLNRGGELPILTDDGEWMKGEGVEFDLVSDWDLELEEDRRRSKLGPREDRAPPKMVHKLLFSIPPGTQPRKVLDTVRNFAREEFGLEHRYAMVLHTDELHPHVHLVVKATSEQGRRLNIRKATLRQWRSSFAQHLRSLGVPANATQRYVRGETSPRKSDGIHRASVRGESRHMRERAELVARDRSRGITPVDPEKAKLLETRHIVRRAWWTISEILIRDRQPDLAAQVTRFAEQMPPPMTEREQIAARLLEGTRDPRAREGPSR